MSLTRRHFLRASGHAALGVTLLDLSGCESNAVRAKTTGQTFEFITPVVPEAETEGFFFQAGARTLVPNWQKPDIDPTGYALTVDGLVSNPIRLTLEDIQAAGPSKEVLKTLRCVIDSRGLPGLVGTARFRGVPLSVVLEQAGLDRAQTRRLRFFGQDGFRNNIRLTELDLASDADLVEPLLCFEMNGAPLTRDHGAPLRLIVPGKYGFKSVKWLTRVEATAADDAFGTYQDAGFADEGTVAVVNKVTQPLDRAQIAPGEVRLFGYALSGAAGIDRVEVSVDDGPFSAATLLSADEILARYPEVAATEQFRDPNRFAYPLRDVWTLFEFDWAATSGAHTLTIRAFDRAGNAQPEIDNQSADGNSGYFVIRVDVGDGAAPAPA